MKFSFFGAAPDTGNLGVSALCYATLYNFFLKHPDCDFTVFDHGRGKRRQYVSFDGNVDAAFYTQGGVNSRRYYRPENLKLARLMGVFGGLGNSCIKTIKSSDAVLDVSGGDSFTDLYGFKRFESIILPKLISLQQKRPLILLPQTYGPFANKRCEKKASEIAKKAAFALARDERSFEVLKSLLGRDYDKDRHICGVDMAFGLPAVKPANTPDDLADFLNQDGEKVGLNISGLIYNNPENAKFKFGLKADYNLVVVELVRKFLSETDCSILLVPHVIAPKGHYESDLNACCEVLNLLSSEAKGRVVVTPLYSNPCEIKWVISKLNWFCGTRMHSTIAALSSGVPTSAILYSPKTLGVFETCGQGSHVGDPQKMGNDELLNCLWSSWSHRDDTLSIFAEKLPHVRGRVSKQIQSILNGIRS